MPDALWSPYAAATGEPITLYEGELFVDREDGTTAELQSAIRFEWLPSPGIRVRVASHDWAVVAGLGRELGEPQIRLPVDAPLGPVEAPTWDEDASITVRSSTWARSVLVGDDQPANSVRLLLVNMDAGIGGPVRIGLRSWRGRATVIAEPWRVTIDSLSEIDDITSMLKSTNLYAFTHVAELERTDGQPFSWDDSQGCRDQLFHLLALARGSLVGMALPVGFDREYRPLWARWECTTVDRWRNRLSWCDRHHQAECLSSAWAGIAGRFQDEFWREVIRRAIRYFVESNSPDPLDVAIPMAQAGLEVLAWAVLEQEGWVERGEDRLDAAGRIRLLLKWAGIPTAIPAHLESLSARSRALGQGNWDGPRVVTHVRRDLIHAPRRTPEWPNGDTLTEAWRLATWYLELVLLRVIGYEGVYGSRLVTEGRWVGAVDHVPWSMPSGT